MTTTNSYFNTSNNISSSLSSWSSGWGTGNTNTGWDYVGQVNGASGTYLGNGWVLTAGHVGAGSFTLNGYTYNTTGVSYSTFTNSSTGSTNADLTLFQISTTSTTGNLLSLSALTLATNSPIAFSGPQSGSTNVMIGYGGGAESWGINTVTGVSTKVAVNSFYSIDYVTAHGTISNGPFGSVTNNAELIGGDSGGGNFINVSGSWQLSGINEAVDSNGNSYFVQLSSYYSQIKAITAVPEPGTWALLGTGLLFIALPLWRARRKV